MRLEAKLKDGRVVKGRLETPPDPEGEYDIRLPQFDEFDPEGRSSKTVHPQGRNGKRIGATYHEVTRWDGVASLRGCPCSSRFLEVGAGAIAPTWRRRGRVF